MVLIVPIFQTGLTPFSVAAKCYLHRTYLCAPIAAVFFVFKHMYGEGGGDFETYCSSVLSLLSRICTRGGKNRRRLFSIYRLSYRYSYFYGYFFFHYHELYDRRRREVKSKRVRSV